MKTKDQLHRREARSSWESQQDAESCGETRSNTADYRILGLSNSTVKLQDARRQNNVTKLIEMFEDISIRNNSLKTWVKSRRSTGSAGNHKNYSMTWTKQRSSNFARILQNFNVLIAMPFQKSGSFIAVAGEIWSTRRVLQQPKRLIATSIPGFVIEKNSSRGPMHGASERQIMFFKAKEMLEKARQPKHGGHPTILARWYAQKGYRESVAEHNIGETWKTWLFSYRSWTVTERQTFVSSYECWCAPKTSLR